MSARVWMAMDTIGELGADAARLGDSFLSAPERSRLSALLGPRRQAQFRAGRLLMRLLLARVHGGDPLVDWPLTAAIDAAPTFFGEAFAQRAAGPWHLSISHSGNYVACAVSSERVGIDVQVPHVERDVLALGDVLCNPQELVQLHALGGDERELYFLALWTLKEAAIKRESGRSSSLALRLLATRKITAAGLRTVCPDEAEADASAPNEPASALVVSGPAAIEGWTWQCPEVTLAVAVTVAPDSQTLAPEPASSGADRPPEADSTSAMPRWAMPPPAIILQEPGTWSIRVLSRLVNGIESNHQ